MELDKIKRSLSEVSDFTEIQLKEINSKLSPIKLKKKDFLLKPGQTCNYIVLIEKGSLRFYITTESKELTLHFFTESDWVADYESFISQKPTNNYLQAIEDSELHILKLNDIHLLMEENPVYRNLARLVINWVIPSSHYTSVATSTPEERYKELLNKHPEWINRFPQMYLASYLGMTKETFSRVKARAR